jgi:hypothetical protein
MIMSMKQNDAVFMSVCSVLGANSFDGAVKLTKEQNARVVEMVTEGLMNGEVAFSDEAKAKHNTRELVRKYTVGMVNNHLRKDKRLNGGIVYEAKNPGSRAGAGDEVLKNLKRLYAVAPAEAKELIQAEIDARIAELKPQGPSTQELLSKLTPEIRARLKIG